MRVGKGGRYTWEKKSQEQIRACVWAVSRHVAARVSRAVSRSINPGERRTGDRSGRAGHRLSEHNLRLRATSRRISARQSGIGDRNGRADKRLSKK